MSLEILNRDALFRITDGDHRAIRYFESLNDLVSQMDGGRQAVSAPSGASVEFAGLPDWAGEVKVLFDGLTLSGTSNILVSLGTAAGLEASGYNSTSAFIDGVTAGAVASDAGFVIWDGAGSLPVRGVLTLTRFARGENAWLATHDVCKSATQAAHGAGGAKVLAGALTRIAITSTAAPTFTGGRVSLIYRH